MENALVVPNGTETASPKVARNRGVTGKNLNIEWKVGAQHALYREDGAFYMRLERFPGALFDRYGYILFESRQAFENCLGLVVKRRTHVKRGISNLPRYVRVCDDHVQQQGFFPENPLAPYQPNCRRS
jgi:hypothetical protein